MCSVQCALPDKFAFIAHMSSLTSSAPFPFSSSQFIPLLLFVHQLVIISDAVILILDSNCYQVSPCNHRDKTVLLKSRDLTVDQGLDYVATMNSARLLSNDLTEAVTAQLQKRKPVFSKLWLCWGEMVWLFLCIFGIQLFEDHYYKSLQYWTNNKRFACFYSSIAAYGTLRN